jgi:peptidoglycan/xylan/chitin deacetylase (PgdA/CDA1 family)
LNALTDEEVVVELAHSKQRLAAELANPSDVFCYPSGKESDFSDRHLPLVREAGFIAAVSTLSKNISAKAVKDNPYSIERIGMPHDLRHFARYISWFEYLRGRISNNSGRK